MPGTLFIVATPIGNLDDISGRALRVLREADVIAAEDTRHTARLLARYAITTPTTSLHEHNETAKTQSLLDRLSRGEKVALVSDAGTPAISDPGQRLVRAARGAGIRVEPIPGPSAVIAALVASGFPSDSFTFLGFPPTRSSDRKCWLDELRGAGRTVVFFEAPHRIRRTLEEVAALVPGVKVCLGRELTKAHEELVEGPIESILSGLGEPRGEYTVLADIGSSDQLTAVAAAPPPDRLALEVGEMTKSAGLSKRQAVTRVARKYGIAPNELYRIVEHHRKCGD